MSLIELSRLGKRFPGVVALHDVSLRIEAGELVAIVGANGAGKSTLVKVLAGDHPAGTYTGELSVRGVPVRFGGPGDAERAGIAFIGQEVSTHPDMSVAENVLLGNLPRNRLGLVDWSLARRRAVEACRRVGLDVHPTIPARELAVGAQQLITIARALAREPALLILDEPTSALAGGEVQRLHAVLRDLRARGLAAIYISHRMTEIFELADRVVVLRDGQKVRDNPVDELQPRQVIREMVGDLTDERLPPARPAGKELLGVEGVCVPHARVRGRMVVSDVSFSVRAGEVVGLAGLMGSGRTELLSAIYGARPATGTIRVNGRVRAIRSPQQAVAAGLGLVPEDRRLDGLLPERPMVPNATLASIARLRRGPFADASAERAATERYRRRLGIRGLVDAPARHLSGGNQQKLLLARWLVRGVDVLLLDDPTRGVDVGAKAEIHARIRDLADTGKAILVVSSEIEELTGLCDRFLVLRGGRLVDELPRDTSSAALLDAATEVT